MSVGLVGLENIVESIPEWQSRNAPFRSAIWKDQDYSEMTERILKILE